MRFLATLFYRLVACSVLALFSLPSVNAEHVLLTQIQTENNEQRVTLTKPSSPWLTVAVNDVTPERAQIALERAETNLGVVRVAEEIGFVSLDADAVIQLTDHSGAIVHLFSQVVPVVGWSNSCTLLNTGLSSTTDALMIGSISSRNGGDGGWLRACHNAAGVIGLAIDEDLAQDKERKHGVEQASVFMVSRPFVFIQEHSQWQMEAARTVAKHTQQSAAFTKVQFQQTYQQIPVVVVLPGAEGADPASIRIRNVTTTGFEMIPVEPQGSDGKHGSLSVNYLAITPGQHQLTPEVTVTAGTVMSSVVQHGQGVAGATAWQSLEFTDTLSSDTTAVDTALDPGSAARFLNQASFGASYAGIQQLLELGHIESWLERQFAMPFQPQLPAVKEYWMKTCPLNDAGTVVQQPDEIIDSWSPDLARHNIWWDTVLHSDDQLRQRVAFALSQIFVVSAQTQVLEDSQFSLTDYYDTLLKHAFGNYRELLEDVTLHPAMGMYLGMLGNEKANPELNIRPDENFAREILQLFSIGVHQLNLDGSIKQLNSQPVPAYDQQLVQNFAKVFTGWYLADIDWYEWVGMGDRTKPMQPVEAFHDQSSKALLNGLVLAAGQYAREDLEQALDNIFAHSNVGPFLARQLIQRLVTSNPSPAYIQRVARVFNNNGQGERGDLAAVIKAILVDREARLGLQLDDSFGKLREPILRLTHVFRAFDLQASRYEGSYWEHQSCGRSEYQVYTIGESWSYLPGLQRDIGQAPLMAPTVFNFYRPDFVPAGLPAKRKVFAPEFQIATENYLVNTANALNFSIQQDQQPTALNEEGFSGLQLEAEARLAGNPDALLIHLDTLLLNGQMSQPLKTIISQHLQQGNFRYSDDIQLSKVRDAISLITMSPEYLIQK